MQFAFPHGMPTNGWFGTRRFSQRLVLACCLALLVINSFMACRPKPPVIITFSVAPSEVTVGEETTLKWAVEGATTVTIDHDIGKVAATGSVKLLPDRTIAYTLTAINAGGIVSKSVVINVKAAPPPPPDTKAPVITNVSTSFETGIKVIITWTTDEPSTGQVEYGKSIDYGLAASSNEELTTTHSVTLNGLEPNTSYHYRVRSKDKAGNETVSVDYTFVTPAPKSPYVLELERFEWGRIKEDVDPSLGTALARTYLFVKGSVRNNSRGSLRALICTMNCWRGGILVKYETYVHRSPILPGQVLNFDIKTPDDPSVDRVTIEFADALGQEIQVIEKQ